mgnify:CR=1 FL=1
MLIVPQTQSNKLEIIDFDNKTRISAAYNFRKDEEFPKCYWFSETGLFCSLLEIKSRGNRKKSTLLKYSEVIEKGVQPLLDYLLLKQDFSTDVLETVQKANNHSLIALLKV